MGFGILFFGAFLGLNFAYNGLTDPIAFLLLCYGSILLADYQPRFRRSAAVYGIAAGVSLIRFVFEIMAILGYTPLAEPELWISYSAVVTGILQIVGIWTLFGAVYAIGEQVGIFGICMKAQRNRILTVLAYALSVLLEFNFSEGVLRYVFYAMPFVLCFRLWMQILNIILLYTCYMRIGGEGESTEAPNENANKALQKQAPEKKRKGKDRS